MTAAPPPPPGIALRAFAIALPVLTALAIVLVLLAWRLEWFSSDDAAPRPPRLDGPRTPGPPFPPAAAADLQQALGSGSAEQAAPAIAVPDGVELDDAFVEMLAAADLQIDHATFLDDGNGAATVAATTDGVDGLVGWTLFLVASGGRWQLAATQEDVS